MFVLKNKKKGHQNAAFWIKGLRFLGYLATLRIGYNVYQRFFADTIEN
jgi:hypothetical protein